MVTAPLLIMLVPLLMVKFWANKLLDTKNNRNAIKKCVFFFMIGEINWETYKAVNFSLKAK